MTQTHPIFKLFSNRTTIRNYTQAPLNEGDLERIIEAGQRAPSGGLVQIYSVVRITDPDIRDCMVRLCGKQQHIRDAAEFIIFCLDLHRTRRLIEHRGGEYGAGPRVSVHYGTMETLLLAANVATAAEALGYGTCFIGAVLNNLDAIAHKLELPNGVMPVVGLTIGVPADDSPPPPKPRLSSQMILHENTYREPTEADLDAAYQAMGESWSGTLQRFFGPNGTIAQREEIWLRTLARQGL